MTPAEQHTAVLAALDELEGSLLTTVLFKDIRSDLRASFAESLAGRRRILERHAPAEAWDAKTLCARCGHITGADVEFWPCDEYRDAAAGFGVELGA